MGNTYSASTRQTLYTAATAKFTHLTKPQIMKLRDTLLPYVQSTQGMVKRSYVEYSLDVADIDSADVKIFGHLFTLCDTGNGCVDCLEYIVGISVLACKDDSLAAAMRFALRVLDVKNQGEIDSRNAFKLLRGVCAIASCFGDTVPSNRQLYKMVDAIYDAVTMVSQENDGISHGRFVRRLMEATLLKEFVLTLTPRTTAGSLISTKNLLDNDAGMSDDSGAEESVSYKRQYMPNLYMATMSPTSTSIFSPKSSSGYRSTADDSLNSHMSSLILTPLAQIPIS